LALQHKPIVISLGGSLIVPEEIGVEFLKNFRRLILNKLKQGFSFVIICGGGRTCRKYQAAAKEIAEAGNTERDMVGIAATRLNAELLRVIFGKLAHEEIASNPTQKVKTSKRLIIGCGWKPGCSTDMDAVLFAKNIGADVIINVSNVDYVYDKDPNKYLDAKQLPSLSWQEYQKIVGKKWTPGLNAPFDPVAAMEAKKSKMMVIIIKGDMQNLEACLDGKEFRGTLIG